VWQSVQAVSYPELFPCWIEILQRL
jgi:hypothetical protein